MTKIEDPYYASKQPQTEFSEEDKSNIHVYRSFYSHAHQNVSQGFFLLIIIDSLTSSFDGDKKQLKTFPQRIFQEPKRHSSLKRNEEPLSALAQEYVSQAHRPGVNTPPPGLQQYAEFPSYDPYSPYGLNSYAQDFSQPPPYPNSGYVPIYVNYQGYQDPQSYYQLVKPTTSTPKKKSAKPSQFRPHLSAFGSKEVTFGQHNAENEEDIVTLINEFETKGHDLLVLKGKVTELALTQTGSRFLQKQLTRSSPEFITFILQEVFI